MPYKDPKKKREYQRRWVAARRTRWLEENGPCAECGLIEGLEVDHIDLSAFACFYDLNRARKIQRYS